MAVNQSLVKRQPQQGGITQFNVNGDKITLSPQIIKEYLVNGQGKITDQEAMMFLALCKGQKLNPFLREAYLIKYSSASPATMVVGKDVFLKRAEMNENYDGMEAGIVVVNDNGIDYRIGSIVLDNEELIGGWCKVYIKGRTYPSIAEVSFKEYAQYKSKGELNSNWSSKGATMIRKVAMVHALREAFPNAYSQMYSQEELASDIKLDEVPIEQPKQIEVVEAKGVESEDAPF